MAVDDFVDLYELLQISPKAETETIKRVYRLLAARYHPDNRETGDHDSFMLIQQAYDILMDPERRASYDEAYRFRVAQPIAVFERAEFLLGIEAEANRRLGVLCLLYVKRRNDPNKPGMTLFDLEGLMSIPREHLEFTAWFLKEEELVRVGDSSELTITTKGVSYVESRAPGDHIVTRLLKPALKPNVSSHDGRGPRDAVPC